MKSSRSLLLVAPALVAGTVGVVVPALFSPSSVSATPAGALQTTATVAPQVVPPVAPVAPTSPEASLSTAVSQAAEAISPSVVQIRVEARQSRGEMMGPFMVPGGSGIVEGSGSGFVYRSDGYVVTNNHVVEGAVRIEVRLTDGRRYVARLIGTDPAIDLAVLKIEATGLVAARFATSDAARVGQWVVAVGAPFGLEHTVTAGVLSATGRGNLGANEIEDYLQTDASINPGNSGGPLVDLSGAVLGVNTMIIGRANSIGFAIPSDLARNAAEQLVTTGRVRRAWLGVSFQEMTPELASFFAPNEHRGALVNGITPEGPAARAGMQAGDVILGLGGQPVADGHDLLRKLLRRPVGDRVEVAILRGGTPRTLTLVTSERPGAAAAPVAAAPPPPRTGIGLTIDTLDPYLRQRLRYTGPGSLVVREVAPGSAADRAGLTPGDVLVELDRTAVRTVDDVRAQLRDGRALVDVGRGENRFYTVLEGTP